MPPRKTRAAAKGKGKGKGAQPEEPAPADLVPADAPAQPTDDSTTAEPAASREAGATPLTSTGKGKAKGKAAASRHQPLLPEDSTTSETTAGTADGAAEESAAQEQAEEATESSYTAALAAAPSSKLSMEERMAKFSSLRKKMADSSKANRKDLITEQSRARAQAAAAKKGVGHARKLANAEKMLEERDLEEAGEDVERHRNFGYTIEDNERWEAKLEEKERRRDKGLMDFKDMAERSYQRQVRALKPDLEGYVAQRAALEGQPQGAGSSSSAVTVRAGTDAASGQVVRKEDLYRDASTVYYGDHRPSEAAIDRVVGHLNLEQEQIKRRSRARRGDDDDGDVDYINKKNQHFNKKLKRYYDEYTKEIRENFERGTAL